MYTHKSGVRLRKIERTDLKALLELKQESWWGTHNATFANMDDQQRWYDSLGCGTLVVIAERKLDVVHDDWQTAVGVGIYSDIDWIGRSLRISGSIYKQHRKDDIVKSAFAAGLDYAFEILNMRRVEAEVLETNVPAQRLEIDYLGFKVEGRKRKAVCKCGGYYDSIMLGILREEWQSHPRVMGYGDSCNENFSPFRAQAMAERFSRDLGSA